MYVRPPDTHTHTHRCTLTCKYTHVFVCVSLALFAIVFAFDLLRFLSLARQGIENANTNGRGVPRSVRGSDGGLMLQGGKGRSGSTSYVERTIRKKQRRRRQVRCIQFYFGPFKCCMKFSHGHFGKLLSAKLCAHGKYL